MHTINKPSKPVDKAAAIDKYNQAVIALADDPTAISDSDTIQLLVDAGRSPAQLERDIVERACRNEFLAQIDAGQAAELRRVEVLDVLAQADREHRVRCLPLEAEFYRIEEARLRAADARRQLVLINPPAN